MVHNMYMNCTDIAQPALHIWYTGCISASKKERVKGKLLLVGELYAIWDLYGTGTSDNPTSTETVWTLFHEKFHLLIHLTFKSTRRRGQMSSEWYNRTATHPEYRDDHIGTRAVVARSSRARTIVIRRGRLSLHFYVRERTLPRSSESVSDEAVFPIIGR